MILMSLDYIFLIITAIKYNQKSFLCLFATNAMYFFICSIENQIRFLSTYIYKISVIV